MWAVMLTTGGTQAELERYPNKSNELRDKEELRNERTKQ
jgi:hypothetical protein